MGAGQGYDIFPRTFKARLLLALAFRGGGALISGWIALIIFAGEYSYDFYEVSCSGSDLPRCLDEQTALRQLSSASCRGFEKRVCLAPLGEVSPELVEHLVDYYRDEYGISITVLTPNAIPDGMANPDRGQIDVQDLMDYMATLFPTASRDPSAILIGVTPVDMYDRTSHYPSLTAPEQRSSLHHHRLAALARALRGQDALDRVHAGVENARPRPEGRGIIGSLHAAAFTPRCTKPYTTTGWRRLRERSAARMRSIA